MTSSQLLNRAQELEDQAQTLAEAALFGGLFASSPDAIDELRAQAQELRAQAQELAQAEPEASQLEITSQAKLSLKEIVAEGESVRHHLRILTLQVRNNEERRFTAAASNDWDAADKLYEQKLKLYKKKAKAEARLAKIVALYGEVAQ